MERYDIKILLALVECIKGSKDFFHWFMDNGYPELAAFSNAVRGDRKAQEFLGRIGQGWLSILSEAIDGDEKARLWVSNNMHEVNLMFALACRQDEAAVEWLQQRDLQIFLRLAHEVAVVLDVQAAENAGPYVMHF